MIRPVALPSDVMNVSFRIRLNALVEVVGILHIREESHVIFFLSYSREKQPDEVSTSLDNSSVFGMACICQYWVMR